MLTMFHHQSRTIITWFLAACMVVSASAETFRFKYQEGQQYRLISQVFQDVRFNGKFDHSANQLNRILVEVIKVDGQRAWHEVNYQNSLESKIAGEAFQYDRQRNYTSEFWRDEFGAYTIEPKFFVPPVRNVPIFPAGDLKPGDTWSANGSEVQDFRQDMNIPDPFVYTMPVSYTYVGKVTWEGQELDQINIDYNVFYRPKQTWNATRYPVKISGYSHQKMYWDNVSGRAVAYQEEYLFELLLSDGDTFSFEGTANASIEDIVPFDTSALQKVQREVDNLNIPDLTVRQDSQGITLSIENIQFAPDSAILLPSEKAKLDQISTILAKFPERDLMVTGHTAQAGFAAGRLPLSEERAKSVGQYLIDHRVRVREKLMFQGMGDKQPVATNDTEDGRARNRRVEITILTK